MRQVPDHRYPRTNVVFCQKILLNYIYKTNVLKFNLDHGKANTTQAFNFKIDLLHINNIFMFQQFIILIAKRLREVRIWSHPVSIVTSLCDVPAGWNGFKSRLCFDGFPRMKSVFRLKWNTLSKRKQLNH